MKTLKHKNEVVKIAKAHRKADRFIQGQWLNGKVKIQNKHYLYTQSYKGVKMQNPISML